MSTWLLSWLKPNIKGYNNLFNLTRQSMWTLSWNQLDSTWIRTLPQLPKNGSTGTGPSGMSWMWWKCSKQFQDSRQLGITPVWLHRGLCRLRCCNRDSNTAVHQNSEWDICSSPTCNKKTKTMWNSQWIPPRTSETQQGLQSQKCYCWTIPRGTGPWFLHQWNSSSTNSATSPGEH